MSLEAVMHEIALGTDGLFINCLDLVHEDGPANGFMPDWFLYVYFTYHRYDSDISSDIDETHVVINATSSLFVGTHAHDHSLYMSWCLVGAEGTDSRDHLDGSGFGTVSTVMEGRKFWAVVAHDFYPQQIFALLDYWSQEDSERHSDVTMSDAVLMQRGDYMCVICLELDPSLIYNVPRIMKPMVQHYVLNVRSTAMSGSHFLNRLIMSDALIGLIVTTIIDKSVTNITHVPAWALYGRFLIYWTMTTGNLFAHRRT